MTTQNNTPMDGDDYEPSAIEFDSGLLPPSTYQEPDEAPVKPRVSKFDRATQSSYGALQSAILEEKKKSKAVWRAKAKSAKLVKELDADIAAAKAEVKAPAKAAPTTPPAPEIAAPVETPTPLAARIEEGAKAVETELKKDKKGKEIEPADLSLWERCWKVAGSPRWILKKHSGTWVQCDRKHLGTYMSLANLAPNQLWDQFLADMDERVLDGELNHPFFRHGIVDLEGKKIYNKPETAVIEPTAHTSYNETLIQHEIQWIKDLCGNNSEQYERVFDLLRAVYDRARFKKGVGRNLPALILLGDANTGKSLLGIFTKILVGGMGNAKSWIFGQEKYTNNLFKNPCICADDAQFMAMKGNNGYAQEQIKSLVAEDTQIWRAMFCEGLEFPWGGLFMYMGNLNKVRPLFNIKDDLADKVIMLKCEAGYSKYAAHFEPNRERFEDRAARYFASIMPHFARWLIERKPKYSSGRFPVQAYIHPELKLLLGMSTTEETYLDWIDVYFDKVACGDEVAVTAGGMYNELLTNSQAAVLLRNVTRQVFAEALATLADNSHPRCRRKEGTGKNKIYIVKRAEPLIEAAPVKPSLPELSTNEIASRCINSPTPIQHAEPDVKSDPEAWARWRLNQIEHNDRSGPSSRFSRGGAN
jgi:hypothetical protein